MPQRVFKRDKFFQAIYKDNPKEIITVSNSIKKIKNHLSENLKKLEISLETEFDQEMEYELNEEFILGSDAPFVNQTINMYVQTFVANTHNLMLYQDEKTQRNIVNSRGLLLLEILKIIYEDYNPEDASTMDIGDFWKKVAKNLENSLIKGYDQNVIEDDLSVSFIYLLFRFNAKSSAHKDDEPSTDTNVNHLKTCLLHRKNLDFKRLMQFSYSPNDEQDINHLAQQHNIAYKIIEHKAIAVFSAMTQRKINTSGILFQGALSFSVIFFMTLILYYFLNIKIFDAPATYISLIAASLILPVLISAFSSNPIPLVYFGLKPSKQRFFVNKFYESKGLRLLTQKEFNNFFSKHSVHRTLWEGINLQLGKMLIKRQLKKYINPKDQEVVYSRFEVFPSGTHKTYHSRSYFQEILGLTGQEYDAMQEDNKQKQALENTNKSEQAYEKEEVEDWFDEKVTTTTHKMVKFKNRGKYLILAIPTLKEEIEKTNDSDMTNKIIEKFEQKAKRYAEGNSGKKFRKILGGSAVRLVKVENGKTEEKTFNYELRIKSHSTKGHERIAFFKEKNANGKSLYVGGWYLDAGLSDASAVKEFKKTKRVLTLSFPKLTSP